MTAETSNARGEWVVQRLRGVLEHGKMGDKCLIAPDLVTAAIAALSAPQPPAEAQPVAKLVNRKDADGGKTTTFIRPTSLGMDLPLGEYPLHLHPPPSAPVGVEAIAAEIRASLVRGATVCTRRRWAIELEALAQQPAARPPKPTECMNGCPDRQVCDHCQWPPGPDQQPAAVNEARSGSSIMDGAVSFVESLATQHQEPTTCKHDFRRDEDHGGACCQLCGEVRQ